MKRLRNSNFSLSRILFFTLLMLIFHGCIITFSSYQFQSASHAVKANQLRKEGKYDEAIAEYLLHIESRASQPGRAETENPYFYYLLIGDIYLERDQVSQAEDAYLVASSREVEKTFLSDRFRRLSRWHEDHGDLEQAIETLKKYRLFDPLLYDVIIDRLHKQLVASEEETRR